MNPCSHIFLAIGGVKLRILLIKYFILSIGRKSRCHLVDHLRLKFHPKQLFVQQLHTMYLSKNVLCTAIFIQKKYVLYCNAVCCNAVLPKIRIKNRHLCTDVVTDTPGSTKYKLYQVMLYIVWIQCTQELSRCSKIRASY